MKQRIAFTGLGAGLIAIGLGLVAEPSRAAQNARVSIDGAAIKQSADPSSPTLAEVPRGTVVRMGNEPQNGWYKVLVPGQRAVGWIPADQIEIYPVAPPPAPQSAQAPPPPRRQTYRRDSWDQGKGSASSEESKAYARLFTHLTMISGIDTTTATGSGFVNPVFGLRAGFQLSPQWYLAGQLGTFSFTTQDGTGFTGKGTLFGGIIEKELTRSGQFSMFGGLGLGLSLSTKVGANAGGAALESAAFSAPFVLLEGTGKLKLASRFAAIFQLGYRVLTKSNIPLSSTVAIDMNLSGPYLGLGAQLEF